MLVEVNNDNVYFYVFSKPVLENNWMHFCFQAATQPLQDLYQWLEVDFHPLKLCDRVQTTLKFVENSEDMTLLQQYLPALREITLVRLLKQVAQVYQSICFDRLLHLAPFADAFTLERVIVDCVRHNDMQVNLKPVGSHRTKFSPQSP